MRSHRPANGQLLIASYEPTAANLVLSTGRAGNSLGIGYVLFDQDSLGQRVRVVALQHRNGPLQHNNAVVEMLVYKMDRAAGNLYPIIESLRLRLKAREGRKQRRVNIEDAVGKCRHKFRREQPHVAGQADQVCAVCSQAGNYIGVVLGAGAAFGDKNCVREPHLLSGNDPGSLGNVGDYHPNLHTGEAAGTDRLGNGEEVRAAAG